LKKYGSLEPMTCKISVQNDLYDRADMYHL